MFVKPGHRQDDPALPLIVRGPNRRLLSPQGENVPEITFWYRRLRDGDVVLAEPPAPPPPRLDRLWRPPWFRRWSTRLRRARRPTLSCGTCRQPPASRSRRLRPSMTLRRRFLPMTNPLAETKP